MCFVMSMLTDAAPGVAVAPRTRAQLRLVFFLTQASLRRTHDNFTAGAVNEALVFSKVCGQRNPGSAGAARPLGGAWCWECLLR